MDNKPRGEHEILWIVNTKTGWPNNSFAISLTFCLSSLHFSHCSLIICIVLIDSVNFYCIYSCFSIKAQKCNSWFYLIFSSFFCCLQSHVPPSLPCTISPSVCLSYSIPSLSISPPPAVAADDKRPPPLFGPLCLGCPGQELQCGGSRGGGWGPLRNGFNLNYSGRKPQLCVCVCVGSLIFSACVCLCVHDGGCGWVQKCRARAMWIILD